MLDCDEATVRRMVGHELEGYRLRNGPRSTIRGCVDSIEAHQRRNHLGPTEPPPARHEPPNVTDTPEFKQIVEGLRALGVLAD